MHRVSSKYLVGLAILYVLVGVMIGFYGTREYLLARGIVAPRQAPIFITEVVLPTAMATAIPLTDEPPQEAIESPPSAIPPPEPTPEIWSTLDLTDGRDTYIIAYLEEPVATGTFNPWSYRTGIFETELFDPDLAGAVSWTDRLSRIILWAHSGPNHTMTILQRAIELDDRGFIVHRSVADERLRREVMDRTFTFVQGIEQTPTFVSAWARIPPDQVEELNGHVVDLPEYLRAHYPDQGWEGFNRDTLILFFCGRQLAGDPKDDSRPYWQQTRYVIGLLPFHTNDQVPTGPQANLGGLNAH